MSKSILGYAVAVLLAVAGVAVVVQPSSAEKLSVTKSVKASIDQRKQMLEDL